MTVRVVYTTLYSAAKKKKKKKRKKKEKRKKRHTFKRESLATKRTSSKKNCRERVEKKRLRAMIESWRK